jgi:hypothetical protein
VQDVDIDWQLPNNIPPADPRGEKRKTPRRNEGHRIGSYEKPTLLWDIG